MDIISCHPIIHSILHFTHKMIPWRHKYHLPTSAVLGVKDIILYINHEGLTLDFLKALTLQWNKAVYNLYRHISVPLYMLLLLLQPAIFFPCLWSIECQWIIQDSTQMLASPWGSNVTPLWLTVIINQQSVYHPVLWTPIEPESLNFWFVFIFIVLYLSQGF